MKIWVCILFIVFPLAAQERGGLLLTLETEKKFYLPLERIPVNFTAKLQGQKDPAARRQIFWRARFVLKDSSGKTYAQQPFGPFVGSTIGADDILAHDGAFAGIRNPGDYWIAVEMEYGDFPNPKHPAKTSYTKKITVLPQFNLSVSTSPKDPLASQMMTFTARISNPTAKDLQLPLPPKYKLVFEIWPWFAAMEELHPAPLARLRQEFGGDWLFKPNETREFTAEWDGRGTGGEPLRPGLYSICVFFTSDGVERTAESRKEFMIVHPWKTHLEIDKPQIPPGAAARPHYSVTNSGNQTEFIDLGLETKVVYEIRQGDKVWWSGPRGVTGTFELTLKSGELADFTFKIAMVDREGKPLPEGDYELCAYLAGEPLRYGPNARLAETRIPLKVKIPQSAAQNLNSQRLPAGVEAHNCREYASTLWLYTH